MAESIYSVGQVNTYIKNMFTQDYLLRRISVKGEVSNCKYHTSGHLYFTLKDEQGTLACVMFAGSRKGLAFPMENGQQIVVSGNVNVYERDGKYQLYAQQIRLQGSGDLYEHFERLKTELGEMGMFAQEYKQPVPKYIKTLGVVTAPTGAAVRDIIQIARRRNPFVQIVLFPALVQGDGASKSVARGIEVLDRYGVDVIIVGRGGGSMEDLWAFNEEKVARAIFECRTPIVSAVGHETDTTIADFVADLRAPTPSAAAELCVYDYQSVQQSLRAAELQMRRAVQQILERARQREENKRARLALLRPRHRLIQQQQRAAECAEQIKIRTQNRLQSFFHRQELYVEKLHGLSPLLKLKQGYGYVQSDDGNTVRSVRQVSAGDCVHVRMFDGTIRAVVKETEESEVMK